MDSGKECPPQVICHMLPEQLGLHQCSVCSVLHGNDHGEKVLVCGRGIRGILRDTKTWCASVSSCVQPTQAMVSQAVMVGTVESRQRHSGVEGSQQGCSSPRPSAKDMGVRSSTVGNVLHSKLQGTDPPPFHHTAWVTMRPVPRV